MEDVIRAVGLYDLVGYLLPGCVLLFALLVSVHAFCRVQGKRFQEPHLAIFLVAAYLTGFMLQAALSHDRTWSILPVPSVGTTFESIIPRPSTAVTAEEFSNRTQARRLFIEALSTASMQAFNVPTDEYYLAEAYGRVHGLDSYSSSMDPRYAFARGLIVSLIVSAFALFLAALAYFFAPRRGAEMETDDGGEPSLFAGCVRLPGPANSRPWGLCLILAGCCLAGARISYVRAMDFDGYQKEAILRNFYVDYVGRGASNASTPAPTALNAPPPETAK